MGKHAWHSKNFTRPNCICINTNPRGYHSAASQQRQRNNIHHLLFHSLAIQSTDEPEFGRSKKSQTNFQSRRIPHVCDYSDSGNKQKHSTIVSTHQKNQPHCKQACNAAVIIILSNTLLYYSTEPSSLIPPVTGSRIR